MKAKQLEVIKTKHAAFLKHGKTDKPDCETTDIKFALLNGSLPKLRKFNDIVSRLKRKIVEDRYSGGPSYGDIFEVPKNGKVAAWERDEAERLKRVAAYRKTVDPVLTKAELHDDSDADDVMEVLVEAAKKHGLYA